MATTSSSSSSSSNSNSPSKQHTKRRSTRLSMERTPTHPSHPPKKPFDIDVYLNPYIPGPRFHLLPTWISRWFGYRPPSTPQRPLSTILSALSTFFGAFCSVILTCWVFSLFPPLGTFTQHSTTWPHTHSTSDQHSPSGLGPNPLIIASLGATALLEFTALSSPLAQPRALLLSQPLAAVIGVAIAKAFLSLEGGYARFRELEWLAGTVAVALASFIMVLTKTVHPPAGATALIAVVTSEGRGLGWWLVLLSFVGSLCVLVVGCVVNNLLERRHWPAFWWTEHPLSPPTIQPIDEEKAEVVAEGGGGRRASLSVVKSRSSMAGMRSKTAEHGREELDGQYLLDEPLFIPDGMEVSYEEMTVLRNIRERLEAAADEEEADLNSANDAVAR